MLEKRFWAMQQLDKRWELRIKTSVFLVDKQNYSRITLSSQRASKRNEPAGTLAKHSRKERNKSHLEKKYILPVFRECQARLGHTKHLFLRRA